MIINPTSVPYSSDQHVIPSTSTSLYKWPEFSDWVTQLPSNAGIQIENALLPAELLAIAFRCRPEDFVNRLKEGFVNRRIDNEYIYHILQRLIHFVVVADGLLPLFSLLSSSQLKQVFLNACVQKNLSFATTCLDHLAHEERIWAAQIACRHTYFELVNTHKESYFQEIISGQLGDLLLHACDKRLTTSDESERVGLVKFLVNTGQYQITAFGEIESRQTTAVHLACLNGFKEILEFFSHKSQTYSETFWERRLQDLPCASIFHCFAASRFPLDVSSEWYRTHGFLAQKHQRYIVDKQDLTPLHFLTLYAADVAKMQFTSSLGLVLPYLAQPVPLSDANVKDKIGNTPKKILYNLVVSDKYNLVVFDKKGHLIQRPLLEWAEITTIPHSNLVFAAEPKSSKKIEEKTIPSEAHVEVVSVDLKSQKAIHATEDLLAACVRTWQNRETQEALRRILTGKAGIRQYPLEQLIDIDASACTSLLRPFMSYYLSAKKEGAQSLACAREIIKRVVKACHITWDSKKRELLEKQFAKSPFLEAATFLATHCFEQDLVLPEELGFIEYGNKQQAPLLAFRDFFFTYTVEELTLLAKNPSRILKDTPASYSTIPTFFITIKNGIPFLHPLIIQKEQSSSSLVAIGIDRKDIAKNKLQTVASDIQIESEVIALSTGQCEQLLAASKNKNKDFYLFTSYMIAAYSREQAVSHTGTSTLSSSASTKNVNDLTPSLLPGMRSSVAGSGGKGREPAEHTTSKKVDATQKKPSIFIPKKNTVQPLPPNAASTASSILQPAKPAVLQTPISSLDELLERFEFKAQEKLQSIVFSKKQYSDEALITKTAPLREKLKKLPKFSPLVLSYANPQLKLYQQQGVAWMLSLYMQGLGGILASEPGLGKTYQAIEFIRQVHRLDPSGKPVCIIVPNSVTMQWMNDLHRHLFLSKLSHIKALFGPADKIDQALHALTLLYSQQVQEKEAVAKVKLTNQKALHEQQQKQHELQERIEQCEAILQKILSPAKIQAALAHLPATPTFFALRTSLRNAQDTSYLLSAICSYTHNFKYPEQKAAFINFLKLLVDTDQSFEGGILDNSLNLEDAQQVLLITSKNPCLKALRSQETQNSRKIIICTESVLCKKEEVRNALKELPLLCTIVDEAHEFAWDLANEGIYPSKQASSTLLEFLKKLKTAPYLLTGTPFVNSYYEVLSLFQLANPQIDFTAFAAEMNARSFSVEESLVEQVASDTQDPKTVDIQTSFIVHEYAKMLQKHLVLVHAKDSSEIQKAWTTENGDLLLPQKESSCIMCSLTEEQKLLLSKQTSINPISLIPWLEKLFFHPSLISTPDVSSLDIEKSGLLRELFKLEGIIDKAVSSKQPILLFVHQKVIGKQLKQLLKSRYPHVKSSFYHGSKSNTKRHQIVQCFEDPNNPLKILILSQAAGGVGLNLSSAKVVIDLAPWWNEAATNQAEARALRGGTSGVVQVYTVSYNVPHETLIQSIVEKKKLWKSYFFDSHEASENLFMQAVSKQLTRNEDAFEKAVSSLRFSKTSLEPALQLLAVPQEAFYTPPYGVLQLQSTKVQIAPLFCTGWSYKRAIATASAILHDVKKREIIIDLLLYFKEMPEASWQLLWNDPERLLDTLDASKRALISSWIGWTKEAPVTSSLTYNEQLFTASPELKCSKNIPRAGAAFTVRLLELQNGHYALALKL